MAGHGRTRTSAARAGLGGADRSWTARSTSGPARTATGRWSGRSSRVEIATGRVSQWEVVPKRLGGGGGVWGGAASRTAPPAARCTPSPGTRSRAARTRASASVSTRAGGEADRRASSPDFACAARATRGTSGRRTTSTSSARRCCSGTASCGEVAAALKQERVPLPVADAAPGGRARSRRCGCRARRPPLRCSRRPPTRREPGRCTSRLPGALCASTSTAECRARVAWSRKVGSGLFNGSPTIAGDTVSGWSRTRTRARRSSRSGRPRAAAHSRRAWQGLVRGADGGRQPDLRPDCTRAECRLRARLRCSVVSPGGSDSSLNEYRSFADGMHGWASREDGVYSTDDGGATWRARLSARARPRRAGLAFERDDRRRRPDLEVRLQTGCGSGRPTAGPRGRGRRVQSAPASPPRPGRSGGGAARASTERLAWAAWAAWAQGRRVAAGKGRHRRRAARSRRGGRAGQPPRSAGSASTVRRCSASLRTGRCATASRRRSAATSWCARSRWPGPRSRCTAST